MKAIFITFLLAAFANASPTQTSTPDCQDHPTISRYPGAVIEYCDASNFSEFAIANRPETGYQQIDQWVRVAGKHSWIYYSIPDDSI